MKWTEVCEDQMLQDLPYKIELNEWGNITMSPASNRHGHIQSLITFLITSMKKSGKVLTECSVQTSKGVKVADVAWCSDDFYKINKLDTPYLQAPELCIEIRSPSNTEEEMLEKRDLYFSKGAKEFWICDEDGNLKFYDYKGEIEHSMLFAEFTRKIDIDVY